MEINFTEADIKFRDEVRAYLKDDYPAHVRDKQNNGIELTKQDMIDYHKSVPPYSTGQLYPIQPFAETDL